ncbi:MAG TPA: hypothetical protein VNK96_01035 [Fimbriimonadales bacterium]|nr:hypothetical protein [Fimbriimonadales bacterium]
MHELEYLLSIEASVHLNSPDPLDCSLQSPVIEKIAPYGAPTGRMMQFFLRRYIEVIIRIRGSSEIGVEGLLLFQRRHFFKRLVLILFFGFSLFVLFFGSGNLLTYCKVLLDSLDVGIHFRGSSVYGVA